MQALGCPESCVHHAQLTIWEQLLCFGLVTFPEQFFYEQLKINKNCIFKHFNNPVFTPFNQPC